MAPRPCRLIRGGDDISSATSDEGGQQRIGIVEGERRRISKFSLFFSLLPQLIPPGNERRQSKSTITDRFQVVTRQKQPQSTVPPGSRRSAYRSTGGPVRAVSFEIKNPSHDYHTSSYSIILITNGINFFTYVKIFYSIFPITQP